MMRRLERTLFHRVFVWGMMAWSIAGGTAYVYWQWGTWQLWPLITAMSAFNLYMLGKRVGEKEGEDAFRRRMRVLRPVQVWNTGEGPTTP